MHQMHISTDKVFLVMCRLKRLEIQKIVETVK
jgi:hypothetical protein